jgi:hypothetical protein
MPFIRENAVDGKVGGSVIEWLRTCYKNLFIQVCLISCCHVFEDRETAVSTGTAARGV